MKAVIRFAFSFLYEGLPLVLMFLPVCLLFRGLYLRERRRKTLNDKPDPLRECLMAAFFAFLIMLFAQTFVYNSGINEIKLIPFDIIISQFAERNSGSRSYSAFIFNVVGNIGIFVPVGMFIAGLFGTNFPQTILRGFFLSLIIETVQLPLDRTTDIDDLILNTVGTAIGYGLYRLCVFIIGRYRKKHNIRHEKPAPK